MRRRALGRRVVKRDSMFTVTHCMIMCDYYVARDVSRDISGTVCQISMRLSDVKAICIRYKW